MQFTITASALLALATSALAQTSDFNPVYQPASDATLEAGVPFEITWGAPDKYADGKISISLIGGADQGHQQPLADIATGIDNSAKTYTWTPDSDLVGEQIYGLVFKLESDPSIFQYSNPFHLAAGDYEEPGKQTTVIVTTATGKVTVTLSSQSTTETPETTSSWTTKTSSKPVTTTTVANTTTSSSVHTAPTTTATTTTIVQVPQEPTPTDDVPETVPTNAANVAGASTFALLGGVVVAMLAL